MGKASIPQPPGHADRNRRAYLWLLLLPALCYLLSFPSVPSVPGLIADILSPRTFPELSPHCDHISPISASSYRARQNSLARVLHQIGAAAYIAEPSASAVYYLNVSETKWRLSERPLLFVITPHILNTSSEIQAKISILTPKFEGTRARALPIPVSTGSDSSVDHINFIEWGEEEDPYTVLFDSLSSPSNSSSSAGSSPVTVFMDGATRLFVADGLQQALGPAGKVTIAPREISILRERKTPEEIDILKCANEATLLAIRATHKRMRIGMHESEARDVVAQALKVVGLEKAGCLTLFGATENAALPHGSGTDRELRKEDFALFDCTGQLHDYWSDVTRTVALEDSSIPKEHLDIWKHVQTAQTLALASARPGVQTSAPDAAARGFLTALGYGHAFTHRLGHGIGLEVHESPYLRGGPAVEIQSGHTFSDEPGVYIEGKVGIRLEDCFVVGDHLVGTYLTAGVGGPAQSPWKP